MMLKFPKRSFQANAILKKALAFLEEQQKPNLMSPTILYEPVIKVCHLLVLTILCFYPAASHCDGCYVTINTAPNESIKADRPYTRHEGPSVFITNLACIWR
jgi:hypothetical protein